MSFKTPITIKEAISNIYSTKYLLPAIQRELVWDVERIERLFDSLMRGYPIGSFLFWKVEKDKKDDYQFYEFIRKYHERESRHNPKANLAGEGDITAILDGQQRLTSLYIGLKGTYASKLLYRRRNDSSAFPERELYLNLLSESESDDKKYDFRLLTKQESAYRDDKTYWFKVGEILEFDEDDPVQLNEYLIENELNTCKFAGSCLFKLHRVIHKDPLINYFEEDAQDIEKVLNIFIRINSGGMILSYSDMLLSIATSQWVEKDAREEIINFVDEINEMGDGFDFDKDFVLKSSLVLCDFPDIAFKVKNFKKDRMLKIEKKWDYISDALRLAVLLIASFGFNYRTLVSNYAVIPIAYYLLRKGIPSNFVQSSNYEDDRRTIKRWLIIALLKQIFGGQPDNVLRPIRSVIQDNTGKFPLEEIKDNLKGTPKSIKVDEEEIKNLLSLKYGQRYTFLVLSLLYPTLDYRNQFHQDHIFPKSFFSSSKKLTNKGIAQESHEFYLENYNYIGNIQLLEGIPNQEKLNMDFKKWFEKANPDDQSKRENRARHYIPDMGLSFGNFEEFFNKREELILKKLKEILID